MVVQRTCVRLLTGKIVFALISTHTIIQLGAFHFGSSGCTFHGTGIHFSLTKFLNFSVQIHALDLGYRG